jgi:excisionase family DNA binding protein
VPVNLKSAARRLGVHYQTAYRWVRSGQLIAVKVGAGYDVSEAALERFEAQRVAVERLPERLDSAPAAQPSAAASLRVLDKMVDVVTEDATAVVSRATRLAADAIGDGAILYQRCAGGPLLVSNVAHRDAASEVVATTVARDVRSSNDMIRRVIRTGESLFLPQVPQRELRRRVHPEHHMHIETGGCYSAICVPVNGDGALLLTRDVPGRPYTRADLELAEGIADRIALAELRAEHRAAAIDLRRNLIEAFALASDGWEEEPPADLDDLLADAIGDDYQVSVAILDIELAHRAWTKSYAVLLGEDPTALRGAPLGGYVRGLAPFESLLRGELDFRSVDLERCLTGSVASFHVAMLRRRDATPWGVLLVAHLPAELPTP